MSLIICERCIQLGSFVYCCNPCTTAVNALYYSMYFMKHVQQIDLETFKAHAQTWYTPSQIHTVLINTFSVQNQELTDEMMTWIESLNLFQKIATIYTHCLQPMPGFDPANIVPYNDWLEFSNRDEPNPPEERQFIEDDDDDDLYFDNLEYRSLITIGVTLIRSKKTDPKTFMCSVCLEENVEKKNKVAYKNCSHCNCFDCFKHIVETTRHISSCPECRAEIKNVKVANNGKKQELLTHIGNLNHPNILNI